MIHAYNILNSIRLIEGQLGLKCVRSLPHFLVLGTQKGGTTSLHQLLGLHPDIFLPNIKEVHYFSQNFHQPLDWYSNHFLEARPGQLRGDITPFYLFHKEVPARIKKKMPNCLLIALLRDPVERAISQYFHACRNGYENLSMEEAFEQEEHRLNGSDLIISKPDGNHYSYQKHSYLSRSRYDEQLRRYRSLFSNEQMLIIRSEDLFDNSEKTIRLLLEFLRIDPNLLNANLPKVNSGLGEAKKLNNQFRNSIRMKLESTYKWLDTHYGITWDY